MTLLDVSMPSSDLGRPTAWTARMVAAWRDEAIPELAHPFQPRVLADGIRLRLEPEHYTATFTVSASTLAVATRIALARLAHAVETSGLPMWDLVSIEVKEVRAESEFIHAHGVVDLV